MDKDIREGMKLGRTREGTVFEVVAAVLIIIMWVMSLWLIERYGADVMEQVVNGLIATIAAPIVLFAAYRPAHINVPAVMTNAVQVRLAVRLVRIVALEVIAMVISMNIAMAFDPSGQALILCIMAACAVMMVTLIYGVIRINKHGE